MLNKSLLFSRLFQSPHFLIGKDYRGEYATFFGGDKKSKHTMYCYEKGDLLITNISNTFIVLRVSLLSVRVLLCGTSRELYTCVFQCMFPL